MASGNTIYWLMNGTAQKGAGQFDGALTGFAAQRLVDFNGDRRLDLLGVQADGRVRVFRYDGVGFSATTTLDAGAGWSPTPIPER